MRVFLEGIGLAADGLEGWTASRPILAGERDFIPTPFKLPPSRLLPPAERRRMVTTVKLALHVGTEAFAAAQRNPAETATVFTSSGGDGDTIHSILETLAADEIEVSPTRFHNSVHNAPSGYWAIATGTREPTTCLCVHDASFSAGLLEAAVQTTIDHCPVGLIAYDLPYPEPLNSVRKIYSVFAVALILTPSSTEASFASLDIALQPAAGPMTNAMQEELEALRRGNPAARSLPLLQAIARGTETRIDIEHLAGNALTIAVAPLG